VPPSIILIVYAISTEQNIVKLFQAALLPALIAVLFYCVVIAIVVRRDPAAGPASPSLPRSERVRAFVRVWPVLLVAGIVIGGIYGGVFTPTEGAGVGAVSMLLIALARGSLSFTEFRTALTQTAETSALIFGILLGAEVFNAFLALSQLPTEAAEIIVASGLPPYAVLAVLLTFYILLGAVMDELAMILLTLPVFFPIVTALDLGLPADEVAIWFGILVLVVVGIGLTAPPIGLNVFVVNAIARDVPIADTYRGVLPFIAADVVRLALFVAFPAISLLLVRLLA
jgi:C4-dicarboxylate transporter DctM subunit